MGYRLKWVDNNLAEDGYRIYRGEAPLDIEDLPAPLATLGPDATQYDDTTALDHVEYFYRVSAFAGAQEAVSLEVSSTEAYGDPHWDKVVSLLHFDGPEGGSDFPDAAGVVWTVPPDIHTVSEAAAFGGSAVLFDSTPGSGGYSSNADHLRAGGNPGFTFGTGDFTIEFRIKTTQAYSNAVSTRVLSSTGSTGLVVLDSSGRLAFEGLYSHPINDDIWHWAALVRHNGVARVFIDGVLVNSGNSTSNITSDNMWIGLRNDYDPRSRLNGLLDEFRITKGLARYTEDYTPSTEPFPGYGPFSPRDIATELWLDAADSGTVTLTSGRVSQWADKSGKNRHATQGTASRRPTRDEDIGAVVFDGSRMLTISDFYLEEGAFFVVSEATTGVGHAQFTMGQRTSSTYAFSWGLSSAGTSALMSIQGSEGESAFSTPHNGQLSIVSADYRLSETLITRKIDGTILSELPSQGPLVNISASWGVGGSTNNFNSCLVGSIREIIFCQAGVSHLDTLKIEGYLAWKWGLVDKLPEDHPYKHQKP